MGETKIIKVWCKSDKVTFMESGDLAESIGIPKGFEGSISIKLSNGNITRIPLSTLRQALDEKASQETYEKFPDLSRIIEILQDDSDSIKEFDFNFGNLLSYKDITDYEFNNFAKIEQTDLTSSGLWIGNGIRKIECNFDKELENFISSARKTKTDEDKKVVIEAYFDKKNNDDLDEKIVFNGQRFISNNEFAILLDTDKLSEFFQDEDQYHSFYGNIKVSIRQESVGNRPDDVDYSFLFPFEIKMVNPKTLAGVHQKTEIIAIDFGTSSTCVAYDKGKKLLSFNDSPKGIDDYENMTALIIYSWQSIYSAWKKENLTIPAMKRSKKEADEITLPSIVRQNQFDYSDKIKEELENTPSSKTIDAIVTNLKSLPAFFEEDSNHTTDILPFDAEKFKRKVFLTDKLESENDETLNPIALYGYLIGRSLNKQIGNTVYSNYTVTMPVNFSKYKKDRIIESLSYGLKRSMPSNLKQYFSLKNDFSESVALLGSAKKLKHLKIENGKEVTLFAVFDFGGGTLDFAFGLYRKATDNEDIAVFKDEDNQYKNVIEVFKTDGELIGGETLIDSLSWEIYKNNQDIMEEKQIPIFVPNGEEKLENFPTRLMGNRHIDHVNLKTLSETFSREFFINQTFSKDKVELSDINGNKVEIEFENLNIETYDEFIALRISKRVTNFKNILEDTFEANQERLSVFGFDEFDIDEVKILQAGNTCKAKWIKESFTEEFGSDKENIIFIQDDVKKITPKNAVAKGALMLQSVGMFNHSSIVRDGSDDDTALMPLTQYIWDFESVEEDGDEAEPLFKRGDNLTLDYKIVSRRNGNLFSIYFSTTATVEDEDELSSHTFTISEKFLEDGKFDIWVKPYDGDKLECVLANKKGDNKDETKKFIINLKSGTIIE